MVTFYYTTVCKKYQSFNIFINIQCDNDLYWWLESNTYFWMLKINNPIAELWKHSQNSLCSIKMFPGLMWNLDF